MEKRIRASAICLHNDQILLFEAIDPASGQTYWFLPGGKIEVEEKPWACAERETWEETGYLVTARLETEVIKTYEHSWNGSQFLCETYFYRVDLREPWRPVGKIVDATYHKGAMWMDLPLALPEFAYCPEIYASVVELVKTTQT